MLINNLKIKNLYMLINNLNAIIIYNYKKCMPAINFLNNKNIEIYL